MKRIHLLLAGALTGVALWWGCAEPAPSGGPLGKAAGPAFNRVMPPGSGLDVCKVGPEGTSATFTVSATGGQVLVSSPFTIPARPQGSGCFDAASANGGPVNDVLVWVPTPNGDPNQTSAVTVTETGTSPGVQLSKISAETNQGEEVVYAPTNSVTVNLSYASGGGTITLFNVPGTGICTDPAATNFGGLLPCVFPPPPVTPCPQGLFTFSMNANGDLEMVYDQFPAPNDNSYGLNAVGWGSHGHTFSNLTGSDHAGFELVDPSGVIRLEFLVDYLSAKPGTPSGYGSLGVTGGDGHMIVGTATGITGTTSLDRNLNNLGYFAGGVQTVGTSVANLLVNSPPTVNNTSYVLTPAADAVFHDWNFHNTYFVTVTAAKLASIGFNAATWSVRPDPTGLHNSPAKECPPAAGGPCDITVTKTEVKDKQVKITLTNNASTDAIMTALNLTWPSATNGRLMQVKLDGDVIYDNPDIAGGTATLTSSQLVADLNKRKINHGSSDVLTFIFEANADPVLSHYTGTASFGEDCVKALFAAP